MVKILGIQTGPLRAKAAKEGMIDSIKAEPTTVYNENGELQRIFLSQHLEEEGEMKDFVHNFKGWLNKTKYNVFLSIGSTSTQGWYKKDGEYHPLELPSDDAFMKLGSDGNKSQNEKAIGNLKDKLFKLVDIDEIHILCFNSIGYKVGDEELILTGSDGFESKHLMLKQLNLTVQNIDRVKSVTVWPRNKKVFGKKLGGSWMLSLINDEDYRNKVTGKESFDYDYIMDMGGSSATLYDLKGKEIGKISSKEKNSMERYSKEEWASVNVDSVEDEELLKDCLDHALKLLGVNRKKVAEEVAEEEIQRFTGSGGKKKRTRKHKKSHKKTHKKTHKKSHKKSHKTHKKRHSKKNARKSRKHKSRK
jgi:hypothetical protein